MPMPYDETQYTKPWKMELHVHTISSYDSLLSRIPLLFMCKLKRIDCIAITDHNVLESALLFKASFLKSGVHVIAGEEIMTTKGEIIGLFLKSRIPPGLSPEQTCTEILSQGGLVYVPHPFDTTRANTVLSKNDLADVCNLVHIMECHNGRNRCYAFGDMQNSICNELGILKVVGSDAHTAYVFDDSNKALNRNLDNDFLLLNAKEALKKMLMQKDFETSAWGKLYNIKLFADVTFPTGRLFEDLGTIYKLIYKAKKIAYSGKEMYFYLQRATSISGITGIWQTNGRNDVTSFEEICNMDFTYIENWSLLLDAKLLFRTFKVLMDRKGAC